MITLDEATSIAERYLAERTSGSPSPIVILHGYTEERADGWVFYYNSEAYLRTGRAEDTLLGAPPLLVDRHTGEVREVPRQSVAWTAEEVAEAIAKRSRGTQDEKDGR